MLFYATPIMWSMDQVHAVNQGKTGAASVGVDVLKFNPIYHFSGFRSAYCPGRSE